MSTYRLATVGSSQTVADELLRAALEIVGHQQQGKAYAIKNLPDHTVADVFLCLPTRVKEAAEKIPPEKIVVLELMPDTAFYVKGAYVKTSQVFIFNNNTVQGKKCGVLPVAGSSPPCLPTDSLRRINGGGNSTPPPTG